jgi:uncharacterized protein
MSTHGWVRVAGWCSTVLLCTATLVAGDVPFLTGRVNDTAGLLSAATVQEVEHLLSAHEDSTTNQVAVLTIPSLEGEDLEGYALRVAETWKLGRKGKDNGVLLLVARDEHAIRIEVGSGLEGALPDIVCGSIIRSVVTPRFKSGDFDGGVRSGVEAILAAIRGEYTAEEETGGISDLAGRLVAGGIFLVVVGVFTLVALFSSGCMSWFLYAFLLPFWLLFPQAIVGEGAGVGIFAAYALLVPVLKVLFGRSAWGKGMMKTMQSRGWVVAGGGRSSGSWSGGGSSSSSSFSGGGGGFSGGGASGGW